MSGEMLRHGVDYAFHDSLRERYELRLRRAQEARTAKRRRVAAWTAVIIAPSLLLAGAGHIIGERQLRIERDSNQISALAKKQGFIGAEAYKPTEANEAHATLWMRGCEPGKSDVRIENVRGMLRNDEAGVEVMEFSRQSGERRISGQWLLVMQTWVTAAQFCALEANG